MSPRSLLFDEKRSTKQSVYLHRTANQKGTAVGKPWKLPGLHPADVTAEATHAQHHTAASALLPIIIQSGKETVPAK